MQRSQIQTGGKRIKLACVLLSGACLLLTTVPGFARRFQERGVSIPEARALAAPAATHLVHNDHGAALTLTGDVPASWTLLKRVLGNLGIKPAHEEAARNQLVTDWVLWSWSPDNPAGGSTPPRNGLTRIAERHRFQFNVAPAPGGSGTAITIRDTARQREIDVTPDSEYSWMKWVKAEPQAGAARSFMRRLQGDFESALTSRLVPASGAVPAPVAPAHRSTVIVEPAPAPAPAPAAVPPSVPAPVPSPSVPKPIQAAPPQPTTAPVTPPVASATPPVVVNPPSAPVPPAPKVQGAAPAPALPGKTASTAVQGGLLVDGDPGETWRALTDALDALGIKLQSSDPTQHLLVTDWVSGSYDRKKQRFSMQSRNAELWAFSLTGHGRQRHRFQLILIPVDGGVRTMVYAYHTGFQEQADRTPDSSQTLLYWKNKKTTPQIALAFLRQLRLVVNP